MVLFSKYADRSCLFPHGGVKNEVITPFWVFLLILQRRCPLSLLLVFNLEGCELFQEASKPGQMRGDNQRWLFLVLRLWQHHQRARTMSSIFHDCRLYLQGSLVSHAPPRPLSGEFTSELPVNSETAHGLIRKTFLWIIRFSVESPHVQRGEHHQSVGKGSYLSNLSFTSWKSRDHPSPESHRWESSISAQVKSDYCVSKQACLHTSMSNKALKRVKIASDVAVRWIPGPQPPGCPPAAWSLTSQPFKQR